MKLLIQRKHEVISGVVFGTLLGIMLLGGIIHSTLLANIPKMYASTVEEAEEETLEVETNGGLTDHQLQKKELGEFEAKYQNSLSEAEEESKGRSSEVVIYTDREGNERWGGYVPGSRDWSAINTVDYKAAKERDTSMQIKTRTRPRTEPLDRSLHRYNRTRLTSQYVRPRHVISDRHFRLKTFANVSARVSHPTEVDYSSYYSSARRLQNPKTTYPTRSYERNLKTQKPDRKRLWEILLDHGKEKKK